MRRLAAVRRLARVLAAFCIAAVCTAGPAFAQSPDPAVPPAIGARAAILVDLKTGNVLFERDARVPMPVASLTKVVTALVARDRYRMDEVITVTDAVNTVSGSKLGLEPGMQMSVRDLLHSLLLLSANDAAVVLAAHDPFGVPGFLKAMNAKAASLGARGSSFANPHGLDAPGHVSTAFDMATLSRALLRDADLASIVSKRNYPLPWPEGGERVLRNHHRLVGTYPGAYGVKTGYTGGAGNCLISAAGVDPTDGGTSRKDLLTVVLKSPSHYVETKTLLAYGATSPRAIGMTLPAPARPKARPARAEGSGAAEGRGAAGPATGVASTTPVAGSSGLRWVAFPVAMLAAAMLLTVRLRRRTSPLQEAAQFHGYLEPLAADPLGPGAR